jgi:hypothetical protein
VSPPRYVRNEALDHGARAAFTPTTMTAAPDGAATVQCGNPDLEFPASE